MMHAAIAQLQKFSTTSPRARLLGQPLLIALSFWSSATCQAQVHRETIAATPNSNVPYNRDNFMLSLSVPSISDSGAVGFRAELLSATDPSRYKVFVSTSPGLYDPAQYIEIAKQGGLAPGPTSGTFTSFLMAQMSGDGQLAFYGKLQGTGVNASNDTGLWAWDESTGLRAVGIEGQTAPGTPYEFLLFDDLDSGSREPGFVQSQDGRVAFWQQVKDPNDPFIVERGIWAEDENRDLRLVALTGQPVPGLVDGTRFTHFSTVLPQITGEGLLAFKAFAADPTDSSLGTESIWRQRTDGGFDAIVSTGDPAPGFPGGTFWDFERFNINGSGQTAFQAVVEIPGVGYKNGLWIADEDGTVSAIAQESQPAPGVPNATFQKFLSVDRTFVLNGSGEMAFTAALMGPGIDESNDTGLWRVRPNGTVELVAHEGSVFGTFNDVGSAFLSYTTIAMNSLGQLAFTTDDAALWAEDSSGQLKLIARAGEEIDLDPGPGVDLRKIISVHMLNTSNGEDGLARPFNDNGQLAYLLRFEQYSYGVFRTNVNAVPEPGNACLLAMSLITIVVNRYTSSPRANRASDS